MELENQPQTSSLIQNLPALLRSAGSLMLLTAAATFLLQFREQIDHVQSYFLFLCFTCVLPLAALLCGIRLREDKGARTFLAVSLALVPIHFAELGALIYSTFGTVPTTMPHWLLWQAPSRSTAILTTLAGTLVLAPLTLFAFSALVRPVARPLSALYLLLCGVLLIPTRDPHVIAVLTPVLLVTALWLDKVSTRVSPLPMSTREGTLARTMLLLPVALLAGRSLCLYGVEYLLVSALFASAAVMSFTVRVRSGMSGKLATGADGIGFGCGVVAYHSLLFGLDFTFYAPVVVFTVPVALAYGFLTTLRSDRISTTAPWIVLAAACIDFRSTVSGEAAFILAALSLGTALAGYSLRSGTLTVASVIAFLVALATQVSLALTIYAPSPALTFGIAGIAVVFAGSYIERRGETLKARLGALRAHFATERLDTLSTESAP